MKVILGALAVSAILVSSALARDNDDNGNHYGWYKDQGNPNDGGSSGRHYHAAPGPIAGAGLPVLAIGYGVYWLVKRRRKTLR